MDKNRLFFVNVRPFFVHFDKNRSLFIQTGPKVASDSRPQMSVSEGRPFYVHLRTNSASTVCSHLSIFNPCIAFKLCPKRIVRTASTTVCPADTSVLRPVVSKGGRPQQVHFGQLYPCVHST